MGKKAGLFNASERDGVAYRKASPAKPDYGDGF